MKSVCVVGDLQSGLKSLIWRRIHSVSDSNTLAWHPGDRAVVHSNNTLHLSAALQWVETIGKVHGVCSSGIIFLLAGGFTSHKMNLDISCYLKTNIMFSMNNLGCCLTDANHLFVLIQNEVERKLMQWLLSSKRGSICLNLVSVRLGGGNHPNETSGAFESVLPKHMHMYPPALSALIRFAWLTCSSLNTRHWDREGQITGMTELLWTLVCLYRPLSFTVILPISLYIMLSMYLHELL